jgi:hypothetical protein
LDFLWEWLTLLPEETPLLHISQYFAMIVTPPLRQSQFKQQYIITIDPKLQGKFLIICRLAAIEQTQAGIKGRYGYKIYCKSIYVI